MWVLDELAAFVSTAEAVDLPARDRAILRRHVADVVAARLAGAACPEGRAVEALYPPGEAPERIAGLAALVRLTETDDIHLQSGTTPGSVAVPVALGLASSVPCSPDRLESAILVAIETTVRLGSAAGGAAMLAQGVWPTRAAATLGAAAAASRVWGLDLPATRHALSLAALLSAGRAGRFAGQLSGRWIVFAAAVAAGIRAAEAARAGFSGDPSVLETGGLDRVLGVPVDARALVRDLGRGSVLPELSLKPYCTSRQALPGAEAMRALVAGGLDPNAIEAFTIRVPAAYAAMIGQRLDPASRASAYVSGAGLAAIAALDPGSLYDVERGRALRDPRIAELARRGQVVADTALEPLYPARWPARIEVTTSAGRLSHEITAPHGDPSNPIGDAELADKVKRVLGHAGRAALADPLLSLAGCAFETEASARALARLFSDGCL